MKIKKQKFVKHNLSIMQSINKPKSYSFKQVPQYNNPYQLESNKKQNNKLAVLGKKKDIILNPTDNKYILTLL